MTFNQIFPPHGVGKPTGRAGQQVSASQPQDLDLGQTLDLNTDALNSYHRSIKVLNNQEGTTELDQLLPLVWM